MHMCCRLKELNLMFLASPVLSSQTKIFRKSADSLVSEAGCFAMPPKRSSAAKGGKSAQRSAVKRQAAEESNTESDSEYRDRRERNNIAVKKSREKSRARAQMTVTKVEELRRENSELEGKIKVLSKELDLLKDLLVLRAGKKADAHNGEEAASSRSHTVSDSHNAVADKDLINQDHGYVSQVKRTRKTH